MSALRRELAAPPQPVLAPATCGSAKLACIWGMQTAPTPGMCGCRMQQVLSTAYPAWRWVRPPFQPWLQMRKARRADAASGHHLAVNTEPQAVCGRGAQLRDRQAREWRVSTLLLVGVGATAAVCSGCLSALSGIGGPAIILMYELLRVPQVQLGSRGSVVCVHRHTLTICQGVFCVERGRTCCLP